jgi:hypothetical protein
MNIKIKKLKELDLFEKLVEQLKFKLKNVIDLVGLVMKKPSNYQLHLNELNIFIT